jgi:hypothetical protein
MRVNVLSNATLALRSNPGWGSETPLWLYILKDAKLQFDFMTVASQSRNRYLERPTPSSLADVIDVILDKGLVIDVYVRVSLVGIELLTIDARIVIASVDTYLRFAEAVGRLDLTETSEQLGDVISG